MAITAKKPTDGLDKNLTRKTNRGDPMIQTTKVAHRTVKVRDLDIFYREAGPKDAPALLLLHGFPTSSQMFRNLIPSLADRYRVLAPDYPGFGHSSMPLRDKFAYTFDNLAGVVEEFTTILGLSKYALYVQDYGAPVGYRLASRYPDRVTAIVVQNGNAYDEGLDNTPSTPASFHPFPSATARASGFPAPTRALNANNSAALTVRSTPLRKVS